MREWFHPFFEGVVCSLLSGEMHVTNGPGTITPCPLAERHLALLLDAVHAGGGLPFLNRLLPDALKRRDTEIIQSVDRVIASHFPSHPALRNTELALCQARILGNIFSLAPVAGQIVRLVEQYLDLNAEEEIKDLLERVAAPIVSADPETRRVFLAKVGGNGALLTGLAASLGRRNIDFTAESFRGFASTFVRMYADNLGDEPPPGGATYAERERLGCSGTSGPVAGQGAARKGSRRRKAVQPAGPCQSCVELKKFLQDEQQNELRSPISAAASVHLEQHFGAMQTWGCVWQVSEAGLRIVKPANLWAHQQWQTRRTTLDRGLRSLGNPATQAKILGDDYAAISRVHRIAHPKAQLKRNADFMDLEPEDSGKKSRLT
uniref:Uncharacterized protein n=1 Tax=Mycena chlorophos TaxID=658473 RepID=A0ABQ0LH67_MYCCL|nr:predicted protein [Mycena chlorophos]